MTSSLLLVASSTFVGAASSAKACAISANSIGWLALTLVLYTLGNLIMLRLIREVGIALSLSAVVHLAAVNLVAIDIFGERITGIQAAGVTLAIVTLNSPDIHGNHRVTFPAAVRTRRVTASRS